MTPTTTREHEAFAVGDPVEYTDALGNLIRAAVSRVDGGRVYVKFTRTNTRGRRVGREVECWFDAHEVHRLRHTTPTTKGRR